MLRLGIFLVVFSLIMPPAAANDGNAIRFGLTAVVVRENLRFFDDMSDYLSRRTGHPVTFVRRKTYQEIMELLESGNLEFAWICGYPFVQDRNPEFISLLTVPIYRGKPFYRSIIIVNRDSTITDVAGLRGRVFAYSDPNSNSGFLYPRYYLTARSENAENYFRQTFFTYNHAETVEAVAASVAHGGAVESYVWEFLKKTNPEVADRTRVIHQSPLFGFPPIVARRGMSPVLMAKVANALTGMKDTPEGRHLLDALQLDGFGQFSPDIFADIKAMADAMKNGATDHEASPLRDARGQP